MHYGAMSIPEILSNCELFFKIGFIKLKGFNEGDEV